MLVAGRFIGCAVDMHAVNNANYRTWAERTLALSKHSVHQLLIGNRDCRTQSLHRPHREIIASLSSPWNGKLISAKVGYMITKHDPFFSSRFRP